jgi:hypothetical protein
MAICDKMGVLYPGISITKEVMAMEAGKELTWQDMPLLARTPQGG